MPAPATARLGRLQLQGGGEATEGPNAMGSNVPTIEESGDDSGRSRWGPAVDPSMRFRDSPSTLVGSTLAADDHSACGSRQHRKAPRQLRQLKLCFGPHVPTGADGFGTRGMGAHHPLGPNTLLAGQLLVRACPEGLIGLVSLPQRCGRARASAGTFGSRREPTPMRTTLVLRRTMRVTSPCTSTHSYSFPDLT